MKRTHCLSLGRKLRLVLICAGIAISFACRSSAPPAVKRYPFTGRIVGIDSQSHSAIIDGDKVPGFMEAMAMSYTIKPESVLSQLAPGDSISAELVVVQPDKKNEQAAPDYWLENMKITGHGKPAVAPNTFHTPSPGEDVPDFAFVNQDGRKISLRQFRGKIVFVTFIYTRCPFPDFCPRMSGNFYEIYKQLETNPALAGAELLSVSFDPENDTPKVLREYGFSVAHMHDPKLFRRWQFVAPRKDDLPKLADFFALTFKPENGLVTHNLSTSVISADGKIVSWYRGGDWQVSDLIKDASDAVARKS